MKVRFPPLFAVRVTVAAQACLLVLGTSPLFAADAPTPESARQRWLRGNYAEARGQYEALAKDAKQKTTAALGLSRCWQSEGEDEPPAREGGMHPRILQMIPATRARDGQSAGSSAGDGATT